MGGEDGDKVLAFGFGWVGDKAVLVVKALVVIFVEGECSVVYMIKFLEVNVCYLLVVLVCERRLLWLLRLRLLWLLRLVRRFDGFKERGFEGFDRRCWYRRERRRGVCCICRF